MNDFCQRPYFALPDCVRVRAFLRVCVCVCAFSFVRSHFFLPLRVEAWLVASSSPFTTFFFFASFHFFCARMLCLLRFLRFILSFVLVSSGEFAYSMYLFNRQKGNCCRIYRAIIMPHLIERCGKKNWNEQKSKWILCMCCTRWLLACIPFRFLSAFHRSMCNIYLRKLGERLGACVCVRRALFVCRANNVKWIVQLSCFSRKTFTRWARCERAAKIRASPSNRMCSDLAKFAFPRTRALAHTWNACNTPFPFALRRLLRLLCGRRELVQSRAHTHTYSFIAIATRTHTDCVRRTAGRWRRAPCTDSQLKRNLLLFVSHSLMTSIRNL